MNKFFSSILWSALGAGVALATKTVIDQNGGFKETLDKAKEHPTIAGAITKTTGVVSDLKQRFAANDTAEATKAA